MEFHDVLVVDSEESTVEEVVYISPQKEPVRDAVVAALFDRSDVGCLKGVSYITPGHSALVAVRNHQRLTKCRLTLPLFDFHGLKTHRGRRWAGCRRRLVFQPSCNDVESFRICFDNRGLDALFVGCVPDGMFLEALGQLPVPLNPYAWRVKLRLVFNDFSNPSDSHDGRERERKMDPDVVVLTQLTTGLVDSPVGPRSG